MCEMRNKATNCFSTVHITGNIRTHEDEDEIGDTFFLANVQLYELEDTFFEKTQEIE
jgi:hypothetical protein